MEDNGTHMIQLLPIMTQYDPLYYPAEDRDGAQLLGAEHKILFVSSGAELADKGRCAAAAPGARDAPGWPTNLGQLKAANRDFIQDVGPMHQVCRVTRAPSLPHQGAGRALPDAGLAGAAAPPHRTPYGVWYTIAGPMSPAVL